MSLGDMMIIGMLVGLTGGVLVGLLMSKTK